MKKNERLIAELFYINQIKDFNLNDLMTEFSISKRTALRDISDLEALGAPIIVNKGRFGGYQVLQNNNLPPLYLNKQEWHSLFLALQLFKHMEQSPFSSSYQHLKTKLLAIAPQEEYKINEQLEKMVVISTTQTISSVPFLTELFQGIYEEQTLLITYTRYSEDKRNIRPIQLVFKYGHWYLLAWDLSKESFRYFRCDYISTITELLEEHTPLSFDILYERYLEENKQKKPLTFKAKLKAEALDLFHSKKYLGVDLMKEQDSYFIIGHYSKDEIPFMVNYLLSFGTSIQLLSPTSLINNVKKHILSILENYD